MERGALVSVYLRLPGCIAIMQTGSVLAPDSTVGDALKRYKSRLTTDQQKELGRGALQNTLILETAKLNTPAAVSSTEKLDVTETKQQQVKVANFHHANVEILPFDSVLIRPPCRGEKWSEKNTLIYFQSAF